MEIAEVLLIAAFAAIAIVGVIICVLSQLVDTTRVMVTGLVIGLVLVITGLSGAIVSIKNTAAAASTQNVCQS